MCAEFDLTLLYPRILNLGLKTLNDFPSLKEQISHMADANSKFALIAMLELYKVPGKSYDYIQVFIICLLCDFNLSSDMQKTSEN